jgi:ABC-type nitrate/sulfonate/bicarbonate transport system ATPase subunit
MALLEVTSVSKSFAGTPVLHDVSFGALEVVCLLGPSGVAKRAAAHRRRLETADSGQVTLPPPLKSAGPSPRLWLMFGITPSFPKDVRPTSLSGCGCKRCPSADRDQAGECSN